MRYLFLSFFSLLQSFLNSKPLKTILIPDFKLTDFPKMSIELGGVFGGQIGRAKCFIGAFENSWWAIVVFIAIERRFKGAGEIVRSLC